MLGRVKIPWLLVIIAFVISMISAKVGVIFPDYQIKFFDGDIALKTVLIGIGILLGGAVIKTFGSFVDYWLRADISRRFRDVAADKIFKLLMSAFEKMNPRELISRVSVDTEIVSDFIVTIAGVLFGAIYSFYLGLELIGGYHIDLLKFQLVFAPVFFIYRVFHGKISYYYQYSIQKRLSSLTEFLPELLINVPIIKIFVKEKAEAKRGEELIDEYNRIIVENNIIDTLFLCISQVLTMGNRIFAVVYGAILINKGELNIGQWIAYFLLISKVGVNLDTITAQWLSLKVYRVRYTGLQKFSI